MRIGSKTRTVRALFGLVAVSIACVTTLGVPAQAQAQSSSGWFAKKQSQTPDDKNTLNYTVSLTAPDIPTGVLDALTAASALTASTNGAVNGPIVLLNIARGDYRRLLSVFYDNAYYGAQISIRINGVEAAQLPLTTDLKAPITVKIALTAGPQFDFGKVMLGPQPETQGPAILAPGMIAKAELIKQASASLINDWRRKGHPLAKVADATLTADHARQKLDVSIRIDPGPPLGFAQPTVSGATGVDAGFITYIADIPEGQAFDPDTLDQARERLMRLGVFRSVQIEEAEAPDPKGNLATNVVVTEYLPRKFGASAFLSSSDGVSLDGYWTHRNLFGRAERLTYSASANGLGTGTGLSAQAFKLGAEFRKPGLWSPNTDFIASLDVERFTISTVTTARIEVEAGFARFAPGRATSLTGFGTYSRTIDTSGARDFRIIGAHFSHSRDSRDTALNATRGLYALAKLTPFHEVTYGNTGLRAELQGQAYYQPKSSDRFVFAIRGYFGTLIGVPLAQSPGDYLFFSGGGGSVRGYSYQSRGVTTGGVFSGGRSTFNASAELRMKLNDKFGLVAFADAGAIGRGSVPDFGGSLFMGAGIGVRYQTPVGPLRLDLARGLNRVAGDPPFAIYLGLGQSF